MSSHSRRQFVTGLAAGGVVAGLAVSPWRAALAAPAANYPATLRGPQFKLAIGASPVNFTGRTRSATVVNGSLPAPILRMREGDEVSLQVENHLPVLSAIHWHGLVLPAAMDGVPGMSFHGIPPGGRYDYRFRLRQNGTYWYHAHAGYQEQTGLYGPLIIEPRDPEPFAYEREHVVMLSDWSDLAPERILGLLKKQSSYFNHQQRTLGDLARDVRQHGLKATLADRRQWGAMRMTPTDRADVSAATYTYLVNGNTPAGNWTGLFAPGERLRLRFINAAAMTYFDVRIPGLRMTVVAADGQYVQPVTVDEFRIATAETIDVIVTPAADSAYTVFAQSMDRSGYARATLALAPGLAARVPPLDRPVLLTMADMGHGAMDHGSMDQGTMDHSTMDHGTMDHSNMDHSTMDHSTMGQAAMPQHPASEQGNPGVDMQTMSPSPRLADPGIGLRPDQLASVRVGHDPSHKVLALADLRSLFADPDGREPQRTIELHLTGNMDRYEFSFDGVKFAAAAPIKLAFGERLRIVLVNDTMMEHPIHLHGLWSDVEDEAGAFLVRKHTLSVPPGTRRSYRVTADALGRWAFHCHLVYHMGTGMFREVQVS
jgi:CopA family copper-resistance protein